MKNVATCKLISGQKQGQSTLSVTYPKDWTYQLPCVLPKQNIVSQMNKNETTTLIKWCNAVPTSKTRSYYIIGTGHKTYVTNHLKHNTGQMSFPVV